MALTITKKAQGTFGPKTIIIYDLYFNGVTGGEIDTGLYNVSFADYSPRTSDDQGIVYPNYGDAGTTTEGGSVYVDSVTNGDYGRLMVIGN